MDSLSNFVRKWTTVEIALLGFCLLIRSAGAHILVYRYPTNTLIEEYNDLPAQFGASLPPNGLKVFPMPALPYDDACQKISPPNRENFPSTAKFVALIKRGGVNCSFELKVRNAQAASFNAVIVYNNEGDDLEQMSAKNSTGINIPSVFVGHSTGINLISIYPYEVILVINDELPFNINTQLILPFSILIGLCFLIMIFYMIYKCIREERRLRRYRLPKSMLKKLPITKFTKTNDLSYDTCVICLEEFVEGDKMRVLPCKHPYHSHCIDPWLTENRRVCPICKRKVFTKGEKRTNRNRQSSLDSVTDTDDDTTPLLRPVTRVGAETSATAATDMAAATTRHGTFGRRTEVAAAASDRNPTSDDENVLLPQNTRRMNPFNELQNVNTENTPPRRSLFSFLRFFRRQTPISVAAPPFLEEVIPDNVITGRSDSTAAGAAAVLISSTVIPSSNNILNPNLCGSFKDDDEYDESPPHSIYEPIAVVTSTAVVAADDDSVFIQTPTQGGIGVAALPNTLDISANQRQRNAATDRHYII